MVGVRDVENSSTRRVSRRRQAVWTVTRARRKATNRPAISDDDELDLEQSVVHQHAKHRPAVAAEIQRADGQRSIESSSRCGAEIWPAADEDQE